MDKIFVLLKDGYVKIMNEKGNYTGSHLTGNQWVSAQVNGDQIFATNKQGYSYIFDKNGNMVSTVRP